MAGRLRQKGVPERAVVVFPNWVDTGMIYPLDKANRYRSALGIPDGRIVVLYSGNMGRKQGLDVLMEAATLLREDTKIQFVLCGQGAARNELEARASGVSNIIFLPLQPLEKLNELLNLADIHALPQQAGAADLVMPSKLSGMLASGRPVIATAEPGTELFEVVSQVGMITPPGEPRLFAEAIQRLADRPTERLRLGALGRSYARRHWDRRRVLASFCQQFESILSYQEG